MSGEIPGDDVVESGGSQRFRLPDWRPSRGAEILAVAALVVGLAAGYAAGNSRAAGGAARAQPTVTVTASPPGPSPVVSFIFATAQALFQDTGACSAQTGTELQLGVQVTNQSAEPVELRAVKAVLPLGGLKQLTWQWGPCGALPGSASQAKLILQANDSVWLAVTFKVQLRCPGPLPVQFSVGYVQQGRTATASLPGFSDLSQVRYSGCPAPGT